MTSTHTRRGPAPKQLNIRLPEQTHRELKAKCALDGFSLADAIAELVRAYLSGKVKITRKPA
jgi:predicted HicB family RNase H-like nuclease